MCGGQACAHSGPLGAEQIHGQSLRAGLEKITASSILRLEEVALII